MNLLKEINQNVQQITAKNTGNDTYGLSDVFTQLQNVASAVDDVERAVKKS